MTDEFFARVGTESSSFMVTQCAYPGCERTIRHPRHMFCPPGGWSYVGGDGDDEDYMLCPEHSEQFEDDVARTLARLID